MRGRAARCSVLGRVGTPEDVAAACVFLIEGSDYITGAFLAVDGGRVVQHP
ncbi:MAG TPA: SDR family oxidoreductase [Candidatus Sumerlaeota bacterium]|nr:SDR family oxidoreductase [Candidatus Sumerlaeota bacterium]